MDIFGNAFRSTDLTILEEKTQNQDATVGVTDFIGVLTNNGLPITTDLTALETKTQNQNAISGTTTFTGIIAPSSVGGGSIGTFTKPFGTVYTNNILCSEILPRVPNGVDIGSVSAPFKDVYATHLIKDGGTSSQYLMADGTVLQTSANSGNSNFYLYKSHANTPTPPPTTGLVYYNNAIQKNATIIYISHKTDDNIDIEVFFNNLSILNDVYIQQKTLSENFIKYNITATPTIVVGSHIAIPVAYISFGGTGETSFGVNEPILVSFFTNTLETDTRLTALETKTQNQTAVDGETNFTGDITGVSRITSTTLEIISTYGSSISMTDENYLVLDATKIQLVASDVISIAGVVDMNSYALANVPTPVLPNDGANKSYVDGLVGSHATYTTSTFPTASINTGRIVYNSDSKSMFFSNGITWLELNTWRQPVMTSMTTPSPYIITTSSDVYGGTQAYKGFDNNATGSNWWHTVDGIYNASGDYISVAGKTGIANNGAWLVMQMDIARSMSRYTYFTRADASNGIAKSWHIICSNDGINYVSADNRVNLSLGVNTSNTFIFPPMVGKYWGIQIYKTTGTLCITQELTFFT